jgi:hypothetical protein
MSAQPPAEWMESMGVGVRVAILDTCFAPNPHVHFSSLRSFGPQTHTAMPSSHGSLMARIIGSRDPLCVGISPRCDLHLVACVNPGGLASIEKGLEYACSIEADVISMSFAYAGDSSIIRNLLIQSDARGAICVAAWHPDKLQPHSYPFVISVAPEGLKGCGDIRTTSSVQRRPEEGSGRPHVGSSISTAVLAGIAACAKASHPGMNRDSLLTALSNDRPLPDLSRRLA